jgi:hypothetical protein
MTEEDSRMSNDILIRPIEPSDYEEGDRFGIVV